MPVDKIKVNIGSLKQSLRLDAQGKPTSVFDLQKIRSFEDKLLEITEAHKYAKENASHTPEEIQKLGLDIAYLQEKINQVEYEIYACEETLKNIHNFLHEINNDRHPELHQEVYYAKAKQFHDTVTVLLKKSVDSTELKQQLVAVESLLSKIVDRYKSLEQKVPLSPQIQAPLHSVFSDSESRYYAEVKTALQSFRSEFEQLTKQLSSEDLLSKQVIPKTNECYAQLIRLQADAKDCLGNQPSIVAFNKVFAYIRKHIHDIMMDHVIKHISTTDKLTQFCKQFIEKTDNSWNTLAMRGTKLALQHQPLKDTSTLAHLTSSDRQLKENALLQAHQRQMDEWSLKANQLIEEISRKLPKPGIRLTAEDSYNVQCIKNRIDGRVYSGIDIDQPDFVEQFHTLVYILNEVDYIPKARLRASIHSTIMAMHNIGKFFFSDPLKDILSMHEPLAKMVEDAQAFVFARESSNVETRPYDF